MDTLTIHGPLLNQSTACSPILYSLPDWFGIPEANAQYSQDIDKLPTFIALIGEQVVGFVTIKMHSPYAAEIHVMGVLPAFHRRGIGQALVTAAENYLREQDVEYLQVKTLSPRHPDPSYAKTRAFYQALGFRPLEELPNLWGEENPCLQFIRFISI